MLRHVKKKPLIWLCVGGGLLLIAAAALWLCRANMAPEPVFWQTIERGLTSRGVTVTTEQTADSTDVKQVIRFSLGAQNLAHSLTTLSQANTTVKNEMIGTPEADYSRYLSISTDQKKADGSSMDFSKVLGVWAEGEEGTGQFFAQALFGGSLPLGGLGVPIGNLSPEARMSLVQQIHDDRVYQVSFNGVKKERAQGRLQYTYDVNVRPDAYIKMMKRYSQAIGLHGLDQLDPKQYSGQDAFKLRITVDAYARQVVRIQAPSTGSSQEYSSYDIPVQVHPPEDTISGTELQQLLSELQ